nr:photosystem I subunit VII [Sanicula orthacantha var. stolonifera]
MQITKKLVNSDTKQRKINQILYPNIRFDNLLPILLLLLVNQKVIFHTRLGTKLEKRYTLYVDATNSTPKNHILTAPQ